ncbi:unnamed protein product [Discula destructiva]
MSPSKVENNDFVTTLNFFPRQPTPILHQDLPKRAFGKNDPDSREITIHDVRGQEDELDSRTTGFKFSKLQSSGSYEDFDKPEFVKDVYYKEVEQFLMKELGATGACVFQHVIRRAEFSPDESNPANMHNPDLNGPATKAHCDFASGQYLEPNKILARNMVPPEFYARWQKAKRWGTYGTWKPRKTVTRDPLVVGDASTIPDDDFLTVERVIDAPGLPAPLRIGNYVLAQPREGTNPMWYYMSEMSPQDIILLTGCDTEWEQMPGGYRCAHAAAVNPKYVNNPPRESIETRGYVIWE